MINQVAQCLMTGQGAALGQVGVFQHDGLLGVAGHWIEHP